MSMKGDGPGTIHEIDRWDGGAGWMAHPEEEMRRASHVLVGDDDRVWVTDPVDAPGLDDFLAELGEVAGTVVCLDRHTRDADAVARRHDVPVYVPDWMDRAPPKLDAPVRRFGDRLGDSGYRAFKVFVSRVPPWQEAGLYHPDGGTLYVPESVGTAPFFLGRGERLGVHPMRRPMPPRRALESVSPERVLCGHGAGVFEGATDALRQAVDGSRRKLPSAYARAFRAMLS